MDPFGNIYDPFSLPGGPGGVFASLSQDMQEGEDRFSHTHYPWVPFGPGPAEDCWGCFTNVYTDENWYPNSLHSLLPLIPGVRFYPDGTFTAIRGYGSTVAAFEGEGFKENAQDYADPYHKGGRDLRDQLPFCSLHVSVDYFGGGFFGFDGTYTTGTYHVDTVNPWAGDGLDPSQVGGHVFGDMVGLYPSSQGCP